MLWEKISPPVRRTHRLAAGLEVRLGWPGLGRLRSTLCIPQVQQFGRRLGGPYGNHAIEELLDINTPPGEEMMETMANLAIVVTFVQKLLLHLFPSRLRTQTRVDQSDASVSGYSARTKRC